jgi:hypothetical protein
MFKMQIKVGVESDRVGGILYEDGGVWQDVMQDPMRGVNPKEIRYERKVDAERMLDTLYPDLPAHLKRVEVVKEKNDNEWE